MKATLALPKSNWMQQGGRDGRHSEHLGHLLSELQSLPRPFRGRHGDRMLSDADLRRRAWDAARRWSIPRFRC
jgi:hypothetical protein